MYQRRIYLTGKNRQILLLLGFILGAWMLLGTDLVSALITFCLSGVVPGTHHVLAPNTVILMVGAGLIIFMGAVVRQVIIAHARWQTGSVWTAEDTYADAGLAPEHAVEARSIYPDLSFLVRLHLAIASWQQHGTDHFSTVRVNMLTAGGNIGRAFLITAARLVIGMVMCLGILYRTAAGLMIYSAGQIQAVWRWAEPCLWRFDGWLERQVKRLVRGTLARLRHYDTVATLSSWVSEYKNTFSKTTALQEAEQVTEPAGKTPESV